MGAVDLYPLSHMEPIVPVACWSLLPSIKATNLAGAISNYLSLYILGKKMEYGFRLDKPIEILHE